MRPKGGLRPPRLSLTGLNAGASRRNWVKWWMRFCSDSLGCDI